MGKFLLVAIVFAALVYSCFWLLERRRSARSGRLDPRPRTGPRTVGPDDDEDFRRDLNRRNRRKDEDKPNTD
ncbi:MAG TPA: hypothetical protein VER39_10565 [Nocardioidaceae bacterium]|nr:hypothetical protein [Nocardioidaceae bacterium]